MALLHRAVDLATARRLPFANAQRVLKLAQINSRPRPVVFTTQDCFARQQLVCDGTTQSFLFPSEMDAGCEVEDVYDTPFVKCVVLKHSPPERKLVSYSQLANNLCTSELQLAYLAHVGIFLDQLYNVSYCSRCGAALSSLSLHTCSKCAAQRYPRLSACAIALVHDGQGNILLCQHRARQPHWGLVAGFCEPGESAEECAEREAWEETGVRLQPLSVRLAVSQPWPFPRSEYEGTSLMLGCFAQASRSSQVPKPDGREVVLAEWVPWQQVHQRQLPGPASVARALIDAFVDASAAAEAEQQESTSNRVKGS